MSQQWSDFPVSHEPSSLPDTVEGGHYVRVAMTSHDLMTVWAAGPARAFRVAVPISARPPVKVTHTNPRTGQRESHFEEFTDDDQRTIDEFVNFGLQLAGIAKFPSGFDWYVRVPSRIKDAAELADELRAKSSAPDEVEALTIITATYNRLLAD